MTRETAKLPNWGNFSGIPKTTNWRITNIFDYSIFSFRCPTYTKNMWLLKLLAVFIQISALLALGHPGKFHSIYFILIFEFPIIFQLNLSKIQLRFQIGIYQRSENFKRKLWCLQFSRKTNKILFYANNNFYLSDTLHLFIKMFDNIRRTFTIDIFC